MTVRFVFFGLLNGWLVLQGPCAIAVAGRERQTDVLGLIFAAGSGMQLVGPAVGGWTYGIVEQFPALLPSLIGCALGIMALILFIFVHKAFKGPEEEPKEVEKPKEVAWNGQHIVQAVQVAVYVLGTLQSFETAHFKRDFTD